jgi:ribosomal protein S18 acetylase RimI-like enzyme
MKNRKQNNIAKSVVVREATLHDLGIIRQLNHELCLFEYENNFDPDIDLDCSYSNAFGEYIETRIEGDTGSALVAIKNGAVVGYLLGGITDDKDGPSARLESLYVLAACRGQGAGSILAKGFLDWAKRKHASRITAAVAPQNETAAAFYQKLGLKEHTIILEFRSPQGCPCSDEPAL